MMHHPNMHHQPMSGHPPQHMPAHQGMPGHHQMHQMHRENRHVTLTRVSMGPSQPGGGMGAHGHHAQPMGGMGAMGPPPHHAPPRQPHPIRAMPHHPPAQHHSVPPQMKPMRRPYLGGGYGPSVMPPPYAQPEPARQEPVLPSHSGFGLRNRPLLSPVLTSSKPPPTTSTTKLTTDFVVAAPLNSAPANKTAAAVPEPAPGALAGAAASAAADEAEGARGGAADSEAGRPSPTHTQANSKEKTPMCLVNELARYNKIKHQYRLTSETGPAHKKVFTVTLRLGDTEEYTAEGSSIKRAQHTAASSALAGTGFPPPPPRALPPHQAAHHHHRHSGAVMPTVELNALAMKLCQPAVYTSVPPVPAPPRPPRARPPPPYRPHPPFLPAPYPRMLGPTLLYRVRVSVGGRAWLGEGATPQAARHDAAARALHDLRPPPSVPPAALAAPAATSDTAGTVASPTSSPGSGDAAELLSAAAGGESKSPVSLVHELALKRNLSVQFGVKSERGPPHMRVFITTCTVGDMETEGEGNGKKVSKRRAAENMLDEMRRRWPPALLRARPPHDKRRQLVAKKKPRNLIKDSMPSAEGASADNPISRLAVARHAARARSPQYRVVEERGVARRREFLVQCDAPPHRATGLGPNKKTAKRRAAHNVLLAMEMNGSPSECPASPAASASPEGGVIGTADNAKTTSNDVKRKDGDSSNASAAGGANADVRQPVPGVLLMDYQKRSGQPQTPNGVSESSAVGSAGAGGSTPGAKDQLMYLSQLLGFSVQFSDFPKRNHGEYLSLVSLSTEPPVMCHGGGPSTAHSHEQCARAALRALKLMGLDAPPQGVASKPGLVANGISE